MSEQDLNAAPVPVTPAPMVSVALMSRPSAAVSCNAPVELRPAVTPVCEEYRLICVATAEPVNCAPAATGVAAYTATPLIDMA